MKPEFMVAVDGGASRTRCAVLTRDGEQLSYAEAGASNFYGTNLEQTSQALTEAVTTALKNAKLGAADAAYIIAGMASVSPEGDGAAEVDIFLERLGFTKHEVVGDLIVAHAGALDGKPGVLVIAGTGSSCIGIAADGSHLKIGGWGPVYGDEGSGYYIGRMALNAAAKAYHGYGAPTTLVELISQAFEIPDFYDSLDCIYRRQFSVRQIAELTRAVSQAAAEQDEIAISILAQAGEDLAVMAVSVLQRLFAGEPSPNVSYAGSVLGSIELTRERFLQAVQRAVPSAQVVPPCYPPYIGAYLLACSKLGWTPGANLPKI